MDCDPVSDADCAGWMRGKDGFAAGNERCTWNALAKPGSCPGVASGCERGNVGR